MTAVDPTTNTVAMPARCFDAATAAATTAVMSCASRCPWVAKRWRAVWTMGKDTARPGLLADEVRFLVMRHQPLAVPSRPHGASESGRRQRLVAVGARAQPRV